MEILRYAAFTRDGHGGNPAGIVLDAADLDDAAMLAAAAQIGYSETAFLTPIPDPDGALPLRYFSPKAEVAFCGHATIATAVARAERVGTGTLTFRTPAGAIDVTTNTGDDGVLRATLTSVPTTVRPLPGDDLTRLLTALRLTPADLDPAWPPRVANAGNDHPVLVLAERRALAELDYNYDLLDTLMAQHAWTTVQIVCEDTSHRWRARDPFPPGGVREDPATGAAAAAFGAYLRELGDLTEAERLTVWQGEDMGAASELLVQLAPDDRVSVTGAARPIPA
ncbi:PhzF family phenazine biosynthesis isomerase [Allosaccharopolyspora coralli]|uniref:PhzF family phenazine biosynthesis isomerase n=1 Tax=Allosaccharopolyspora coralli TaxID=2665642 RepID=A0A5Q3Q5T9_9PSEU|nr:PhzF family phenazine biosynthesis isomerase [Allosaccharopolyspora coralli]QGK69991.1 PhzF family phenazine biosynthesis isomerase [Allosaccharopolyspora coralli]